MPIWHKGEKMDKDTKYLIEEIRDIAKFNENHAMCAFKLGLIKGLCDGYIEFHKDQVEIPVENEDKKITFEEYCQQETDKNDNWLNDILDRRGNHMNLNFEISSRWGNPSNKKMIIKLLNQKKICNMNDLMTIFDDPINLNTLRYMQSANKENQKNLNKIFPLFELSDSDRKQIASLYMTANDYPEKGNSYGVLSDIYFRHFLTPDDISSAYSKRYLNAFIRNGITNVNQLHFFLKNNGINAVKSLKGVGHISENIMMMNTKIKEEK